VRMSRFTRQRWLLSLLAVLAIVAAACGTGTTSTEGEPAGSEPAEAGSDGAAGGDSSTLVVGATEVPSHLDPAVVYEKMASDILYNTTNRLVEFDGEANEVGPGLAEEWETSDDGTVYTFHLREGMTFHDGSDLTSEDVKWSLERAININHPESASFLLGGIETIETPDDLTVEITLSEPSATFLPRLNYTVATILPSDGDVYTAPDAALGEGEEPPSAQEAEEFINDEEIVGSGPYELTNYTPGESLTLEAYDDYWGEAPAIDTVQIQFFETSAQMKNAMSAGEIDLNVNEFAPAERAALEQEGAVEITEGDVGRIRYMILDVTAEPYTDPEVRRAISASIDRQRIIDEVFEGAGVPLYSMIPSAFEESVDYISEVEAEVPEGTEIELWYPLNKYGDTEADVAETIRRSLEEAGFAVTLQSADWAAEYSDNTTTGAYSAYLLGWFPDFVDADNYIEPFYGGGYIPYYQDEQMQELIAQEQSQEIGSPERAQTFDQIQQKAAEDMPYIPLYEERQIAYSQDTVSGVEDTLTAAQQTWYFVLSKEG
jgi:peptide/nickel transport system substrate-binding protein